MPTFHHIYEQTDLFKSLAYAITKNDRLISVGENKVQLEEIYTRSDASICRIDKMNPKILLVFIRDMITNRGPVDLNDPLAGISVLMLLYLDVFINEHIEPRTRERLMDFVIRVFNQFDNTKHGSGMTFERMMARCTIGREGGSTATNLVCEIYHF